MNFNVVNKELCVQNIRIIGVASASVVLIGDAETIGSSSIFDTPPESLIVGESLVPLAPVGTM
ncbi:spore germination protein PD [Scopulibacillus darangshiensis]|uniref:Spore germination protein PD n=1 Tax=Scopulibacillus darangshiensis TaxID=442528 RepID=A0A4R2P9A4_9BACL|nr:spore gernimation protein GerPD [Scopulibacillus darangshiensis]TCP31593.1 spore germination protein PD [Scopulibacillus darangshiensis]